MCAPVSRKLTLLLYCLLLTSNTEAQEPLFYDRENFWVLTTEVDGSRLTIFRHLVSQRELEAVALEIYGRRMRGLTALTLLFEIRDATGQVTRWECELYLTDATSAEQLEHELRHCHGWTHDVVPEGEPQMAQRASDAFEPRPHGRALSQIGRRASA
jgi:hypothetical protein